MPGASGQRGDRHQRVDAPRAVHHGDPLDPASPADPVEPVDLGRPRRIHIVGVGGTGMSVIAEVLAAMGHHVTGSDVVQTPVLDRLRSRGVAVTVGQSPANVGGAEVVAYSTAVPLTNVEVVAAAAAGRQVVHRSGLLAGICATRRPVAVAGTHGKTTTSAMLTLVLRAAGLHPAYVIGGDVVGLGPGAGWDPDGDWLVVEADESDGTFLRLGAQVAVVTSVEPDHLDYYGGVAAMEGAFAEFLRGATGPRVVCADDPVAARLGAEVGAVTYGTTAGADLRIADYRPDAGGGSFAARWAGEDLGRFGVAAPGIYNARNAAAAMTVALRLGVPPAAVRTGLAAYRGVGRRFERRGEAGGVTYVDDYGHLPTEVASVLAAARAGGWRRVVAVFQPHRYSRTASLAGRFADAFVDADVVVLAGIYPAGEAPRPGVTGRLVADAVTRAHPDAAVTYVEDRRELAGVVRNLLRPGDLCLTLGAGDITRLPDELQGGPA